MTIVLFNTFIMNTSLIFAEDIFLYNKALNYCMKKYGFNKNDCYILPYFTDVDAQKELQDKYNLKLQKYSPSLAIAFKNNKKFDYYFHDSISRKIACRILKVSCLKMEKDIFSQIDNKYKKSILVSFPLIVYDKTKKYAIVTIYFYSNCYQENRSDGSLNTIIYKYKYKSKEWQLLKFNRFAWG